MLFDLVCNDCVRLAMCCGCAWRFVCLIVVCLCLTECLCWVWWFAASVGVMVRLVIVWCFIVTEFWLDVYVGLVARSDCLCCRDFNSVVL